MIKFIYLESFGCSANQNNAEIMKGLILQSGLELTSNLKIADILIINTCIVKGPTENKIEARIKKLEKLDKPVIVAGCMPEVRAEKLQHNNLYLLGTHHVKDIPKLIRKISENKYKEEFLTERKEEKLLLPKISQRKDIGITQILEGCTGFCCFCITRQAKGSLFSYSEEKILENIKADLKSCKEIWLTSQDNAAYGLDTGERKLPQLLKKIIALKGRFKIRLGMMNLNNVLPILENLIEIYKNKKMKKFLHLPLQSGSDRILKAMNRQYTTEQFLQIINKFKQEIPDLILWTDIIVGYPGEEEEDFLATLKIVNEIKPSFINISRFWPIKGTEASQLEQVPLKIVKERIKKLFQVVKNQRFLSMSKS